MAAQGWGLMFSMTPHLLRTRARGSFLEPRHDTADTHDYFLPPPYCGIEKVHWLLPMQAQQYPVEPLELLGSHCSVHE